MLFVLPVRVPFIRHLISVLAFAHLVSPVIGWWQGEEFVSKPLAIYKTEPDLKAAVVNITHRTNNLSELAPGYYFLTAFARDKTFGPHIFDRNGDLVWLGEPLIRGRAQAMDVCDYLSHKQTHLCFVDFERHKSASRVLDNTYTPLKREYRQFDDDHYPTYLNSHELNMLPGGERLIQAVHREMKMDLRIFNGREHGVVKDSCFHELGVATGEELFRWCWLDHLPVTETHGSDFRLPVNYTIWDAIHLNSVDKNSEGDYMISLRHTDQIIKIAGKKNANGLEPGSIIWRLGGYHSDFDLKGPALFSAQHHARFVNITKNREIISIFNNANNGANTLYGSVSAGMILSLNNKTKKATMIKAYPHPYDRHSPAQGSMQVLSNGNVVVGWGGATSWSEFSKDGKLLFHANVSAGPINYRTQKFQWDAQPAYPPKLVAYCRTCNRRDHASPLVAYVSWNGATRIKSWRFSVSINGVNGSWIQAGTFKRSGFETKAYLSSTGFVGGYFLRHVRVQALDAKGLVLGTAPAKTFVPRWGKLRRYCDKAGCRRPRRFHYDDTGLSRGDSCNASVWPALIFLVAAFGFAEVSKHALLLLLDIVAGKRSEDDEYELTIR